MTSGERNLFSILSKVLGTADTLAAINEVTADEVRAVGDSLAGTDAEVASTFNELSGELRPAGGSR